MKKSKKEVKKNKKKSTNRKKLEKALDKAWSEYIHRRDVCCCICGGRNALQAHHAFGRVHRGTRWNALNGVLLCWPHHKYFAHGDPCGFANWFSRHIGKDNYNNLDEIHNQVCRFTEEDLEEKLNWFKKEGTNDEVSRKSDD